MGSQASKSKNRLLTSEKDDLGKYSCRVARDNDNPIQISPNKIKIQFSNRYLYFPLPNDFLKSEFNRLCIFIENFSTIPNGRESCQIIRNNINPIKNIIDKVEYIEYHALSDNKGKFVVRINKTDSNKSVIVYSNSVIN